MRADGDDERHVVGEAGIAGREEPEPARETHAHDSHARAHALAQGVRRIADRVRRGALDAVVEELGDLRREDDDAARRHRAREAHEARLFDAETVHARDEDDRAARRALRQIEPRVDGAAARAGDGHELLAHAGRGGRLGVAEALQELRRPHEAASWMPQEDHHRRDREDRDPPAHRCSGGERHGCEPRRWYTHARRNGPAVAAPPRRRSTALRSTSRCRRCRSAP